MTIQPEVPQDGAATRTALATPKLSLKDWFRCATIVLIALNVMMFLMMVLQGVAVFNPTADSVLRWGADYGPLTLQRQWWRMVLSTFLGSVPEWTWPPTSEGWQPDSCSVCF